MIRCYTSKTWAYISSSKFSEFHFLLESDMPVTLRRVPASCSTPSAMLCNNSYPCHASDVGETVRLSGAQEPQMSMLLSPQSWLMQKQVKDSPPHVGIEI